MAEQQMLQKGGQAPKKKGRLGCFAVVLLALAVFILGFLAGPIGQGMFKGIHLPEWLSVQKPITELPAHVVFHIFGFPITNSVIATWVTMVVLICLFPLLARRMKEIPGRSQSLIEFAIGSLLNFCKNIAGEKNGRSFFPIVATIFLFVSFNGWLGLVPVYGSVGVINITSDRLIELAEHVESLHLPAETEHELVSVVDNAIESLRAGHKEETVHYWEEFMDVAEEQRGHGLTDEQAGELVAAAKEMEPHLLKPANTDINTPLAIALMSFVFVLFFGFKSQKLGFLKQYFNFGKFIGGLGKLFTGKISPGLSGIFLGIIDIFIGLVEFMSLLVRNISFTLRLFGNMTAGEILLVMVTFLVPYLVALPFYGLELIVGFVQALIFASLTLIFLTMAVTSHEHSEEKHH